MLGLPVNWLIDRTAPTSIATGLFIPGFALDFKRPSRPEVGWRWSRDQVGLAITRVDPGRAGGREIGDSIVSLATRSDRRSSPRLTGESTGPIIKRMWDHRDHLARPWTPRGG